MTQILSLQVNDSAKSKWFSYMDYVFQGYIFINSHGLLQTTCFIIIDRYGFTKSFQERPNNVRNGIRLSNGSSFEVEIKVSRIKVFHSDIICMNV